MVELRIDPEFRDKIPPLTDAEFEQLRENILADGEVYEPIAVWNGVIVDGHNRWRVIQEHPEIPYKVKEIEFTNKWEAFAWMYKKQLGRRNLSDEQKTYLMGKRNEAEKLAIGSNQHTHEEGVQNGPARPKGKTAQRIADEYGVGYGTVLRAEQFAKGVDALSEVSKEAADKILSGAAKVPKAAVAELKEAGQETVQKFAEDVIADRPVKATRGNPASLVPGGFSKEERERRAYIASAAQMLYDTGTDNQYNLDSLVCDIEANGNSACSVLKSLIEPWKHLFESDDGRKVIAKAIDDYYWRNIIRLKGEFNL